MREVVEKVQGGVVAPSADPLTAELEAMTISNLPDDTDDDDDDFETIEQVRANHEAEISKLNVEHDVELVVRRRSTR